MRNNIILFSALVLLCGGVLGCDKFKPAVKSKPEVKIEVQPAVVEAKGPVVAKVNNISIGLDDLNAEITVYNANVPEDRSELKITTKEQKVNYLKNEMVRRALLYQHALDNGLDRDEEVRQAVEKNKRDLMVLQDIKEIAKDINVTSKEVEDYYNTYKDQFKEPEERQVSEIIVGSEQDARDVLIQLLQGADFAALARSSSRSGSAKDGGNIGFIKKGQKSAQFDAVAFSDSLDIGKVSNIFKVPEGYAIIRLEAKRGGKQRPLSEMWDDINRGLVFLKQQQAIEELIGKLSRDAKIEVFEGEIK
ncbi:MAG: peptidyl-prolyl cis-trans isomerase [Candidatus Omnitrophica bacterium]|nr:peptidyl-prolyl cis-trans isomerase [Candidatus Omnitrophota bacterium]MDD5501194.1 peptidyl-prolyl cis-trans isomerase [Candidatus Omnitrophota bacterium]